MKVLKTDAGYGPGIDTLMFHCPGCKSAHMVTVNGGRNGKGATWQWNQDIEKPTLSPSIGVSMENAESRCHSFVRDGKIQFLSDCFHELKGQTVDLPDWED